MNFKEYQDFTTTTAIYRDTCETFDQRMSYLTLGLTGEAGECAEKVKKRLRDGQFDVDNFARELGDVLYYLTRLADEIGYDLSVVASINKEKLSDRQKRHALGGSGDYR